VPVPLTDGKKRRMIKNFFCNLFKVQRIANPTHFDFLRVKVKLHATCVFFEIVSNEFQKNKLQIIFEDFYYIKIKEILVFSFFNIAIYLI